MDASPAADQQPKPPAPAPLVEAVDLARRAAVEEAVADLGPEAGAEAVGEHLGYQVEDAAAVTHYFAARQGGYRGWRWAATLSWGGEGTPVTVSEVVLLPGEDAIVAPPWVPWQERVRPGDLGVGDLLPTPPGDPRLVPGYLAGADDEEDPVVAEVVHDLVLHRPRVLSQEGRAAAAARWLEGPHGPGADMARAAPGECSGCGFFIPLSGPLRAVFGVCANEYSPADGAVVAARFGCGAHSDVQVEPLSPVAVAEIVYDDGIDLEPISS